MLLINWYPSSLLCHHLYIQLRTRELKTICRLKFNVDSAGSIQTPLLPLTVMEARIYKRYRGLSQPLLCFTPLCYDRATNGSIKYSLFVNRRATTRSSSFLSFFKDQSLQSRLSISEMTEIFK